MSLGEGGVSLKGILTPRLGRDQSRQPSSLCQSIQPGNGGKHAWRKAKERSLKRGWFMKKGI